MKYSTVALLTILLSCFLLTSCELIGDIFSAGVYTGVFLVALILAIVIFVVVKLRKRS